MTTEQQSREAAVLNNLSAIYPDIEAFYIDLHEHPELSMQEVQTSAKVASVSKMPVLKSPAALEAQGWLASCTTGQVPRSCYAEIWMLFQWKRRRAYPMPAK